MLTSKQYLVLELFPSPGRLLDVTPAGQQCDFPLQGYVEKTGSTSFTVSVCPVRMKR